MPNPSAYALEVEASKESASTTISEVGASSALLSLQRNPLLVSILDSVETLKKLNESNTISPAAITSAKGLLCIRTDKVGLGISLTQGYGLVMQRLPNAPNGWSAPLPIKVDGFSVGAVAGYSQQQSIIALANEDDLVLFMRERRKLKMGFDFGVSADKLKLHKATAVSSDQAHKNDESGFNTKCWTLSKGYIVDVSLNGTSMEPDTDDMEAAYGKNIGASEILNGKVPAPRETLLLYKQIRAIENKYSAPISA